MSLHDAANQVQSAGRGEDKVLVHMTPKEVGGLQSLAMAHGGSLTINPQTGLPEAGFLSSLLPMAIGFGLAPFTGGLSAALITGAGYTAATGSLKKGIMAGLGAYGGAGLAGGLNAMGATAAAPAGQNAAQAAITGAGNNAANFAGVGSNPFSTNTLFNPTATSAATSAVPTTTTAVTSAVPTTATAATNAATVYPPGHPLYTPAQSQMNLASQTFTPSSATSSITPTSLAERQAILARTTPVDMADPNAFVTTNVPNQPITRPLLDDPGFTQYRDAAKLTPRPASPYVQPDRLAQYRGVDFTKGMQHTPTTSTAVDVSGQSISRPFSDYMSQVGQGAKKVYAGGVQGLKDLYAASEAAAPYSGMAGLGSTAMNYYAEKREEMEEEMRRRANKSPGLIRPYEFDYNPTNVASEPYSGSGERTYFQPTFTALKPYEAPGPEYKKAAGGLTALAVGGPVEQMAAMNAVGANTGYPMAKLQTPMYANSAIQNPEAANVIAPSADAGVGSYTGEARFAAGGSSNPTTRNLGGSANPNTQGRSGTTTSKYDTPSGYKYDYDPATMQFTQVGGPKSTKLTGGTAQPVMQPTNPAQPLIPNINIPAYQTPEQQLGLGGFYDMMNQQLGGYGDYAGEERFARGGPAFMNQTGTGHYGAGSYSKNARLPESKAPIPSSSAYDTPSGYKYGYDPSTMQFTQTGGPGASKAPAVGGMAQPVMQPAPQAQSFVSNMNPPAYQAPMQQSGLGGFYNTMNQQMGGFGGYAAGGNVGGISHLGDYSDGGRLLKGPGDGVSDSIPASIGNRQPARLADGEFVVPARIVSEIGNGSTEAGARKLYAMMDRVQRARRKTVGKGQVAKNTKAEKLLPA